MKIFKTVYKLALPVIILASLIPFFNSGHAFADPGCCDSSWLYRKFITIDHAKVTADLTSFPVMISQPI